MPGGTNRPLISIVIPAYNEEVRLRQSLDTILANVTDLAGGQEWEILVANDGSTDRTSVIAHTVSRDDRRVRILDLPHRGKGATVRSGVLEARGALILFTDADLATPISESVKLFDALESGAEVAIGSRAAEGATRLSEPFYREAMGFLFHHIVCFFLMHQFSDTQCGFKAFRRGAARDIFRRLVLYNDDSPLITHAAVTGFDLEVLYLAAHLGYRIEEVPVEWHYRSGSKVNPLRDSFELFRDVLRVRMNARKGVYNVCSNAPSIQGVAPITNLLPEVKDDSHVV